jgi:hypothetical protein
MYRRARLVSNVRRTARRAVVVVVAAGILEASTAAAELRAGATLCLHPMQLPFRTDEGGARRAAIERRVEEGLVAAGFRVVPAAKVVAVLERELQAAGGFVDPATGVRDGARLAAFRARAGRELGRELACDAQVTASIVPVQARFNAGLARWDGASQQVVSTGRIALTMLGGVIESGWVGAFSLWLLAQDLAGEDVAFRSAGIETLVELAVLQDKDLLPEDQWLADGAKLDAALHSALGPGGSALLYEGTPAGGPLRADGR